MPERWQQQLHSQLQLQTQTQPHPIENYQAELLSELSSLKNAGVRHSKRGIPSRTSSVTGILEGSTVDGLSTYGSLPEVWA